MSADENKLVSWKFCPRCGMQLPEMNKLRFCINCGLDLVNLKQNKTVPTTQVSIPSPQTPVYYAPPVQYKPYKVIPDDELRTSKERLWGAGHSVGFPILSVIVMNAILIGIVIALILINYDLAVSILLNPLFLVVSTFIELFLILIPLLYIKRFLQNPTLKNRLALLGFTREDFDQMGLIKEIFIGIGFAFAGLGLVIGSSLIVELILQAFGITIEVADDADVLVSGLDVLFLILMIIMMIVIVGPCEEILFRGYMQKGLVRVVGDKWGIFITAFIFAIIHLMMLPVYLLIYPPIIVLILFFYLFVPYIAISLMLGLLFRWRKENLIAVIITHGVYNSLTLLISFLFMVFY